MPALHELRQIWTDYNALDVAARVLHWDQQTYMPKGGADARARHSSILSRMAHETLTSDRFGRLLDEAQSEVQAGSDDAAWVRVAKRTFDLRTKLPASFVERKARLSSIAHEKWVEARAKSDFATFADTLTEMFELAREEAELLGYTEDPYDALLDQYEEGATSREAREMFETLKKPTIDLVKQIRECGRQPDTSALYGDWDVAKQSDFTLRIIKAIGFDLNRGRQDMAPHPFCTNFSIDDVRLTTRFLPYLGASIFGSLHEAGHGVYEQGSDPSYEGGPLAGGTSLGVHESQSRLWENIVGRSRPFWSHFLPHLQSLFPALDRYNLDGFVWAVNKVEPSYIRVEADEVTYNLHVLLRFELESDILSGRLAVYDLPEAWSDKMRTYLGILPPDDARGCLQDVHWSMGSIGYFPTYTMGNLLSYQIWACLCKDVSDIDSQMAQGHFEAIFEWLCERVYRHGSKYPPKELVPMVTGKPMGADDWVAGVTAKYSALYGLGG